MDDKAQIEDGVPLPEDRRSWEFKTMQVGQAIFIDCDALARGRNTSPKTEARRVSRYARHYGYLQTPQKRFTCRSRTEGTVFGVRIWRKV